MLKGINKSVIVKTEKIVVALDIGTTKITVVGGKKNIAGNIEIIGYRITPHLNFCLNENTYFDKVCQTIKDLIGEVLRESGNEIINVNVIFGGLPFHTRDHYMSIFRHNYTSGITQQELERVCDSSKLYMEPSVKIISSVHEDFTLTSVKRKADDTLEEYKKFVDELIHDYAFEISTGEFFIKYVPKAFLFDEETGVKNPPGKTCLLFDTNLILAVAKTELIKKWYECLSNAGLVMEKQFLEPIASAEAVLDENDKEEGVVLMDIGGACSTIAVFQEGFIRHLKFIPLGGENITSDIMEKFSLTRDQAEKLKIENGSAIADEKNRDESIIITNSSGNPEKEISVISLNETIQQRMEEIVDYINFSIKKASFEKRFPSKTVLTGGGALLKNLVNLVTIKTKMPARIGYPDLNLETNTFYGLKNPMYAAAIGAVIKSINPKI